MAYIDTDFISANLFNGELVPGPNTISEAKFNGILTRVTNFINGVIHSDTDVDDTHGDLAEVSLCLFRQAIQNQELTLSRTQETLLKGHYKEPRYGHI